MGSGPKNKKWGRKFLIRQNDKSSQNGVKGGPFPGFKPTPQKIFRKFSEPFSRKFSKEKFREHVNFCAKKTAKKKVEANVG